MTEHVSIQHCHCVLRVLLPTFSRVSQEVFVDWFAIIVGVLLIVSGSLRLKFNQRGRLREAPAVIRNFPWVFVVAGVLFIIVGVIG